MKMAAELEDCPCTGKSMSNLMAPWILLTLHSEGATHGYELARIIKKHHEALGIGLNLTGLYRHLYALEQRGMLLSQWDRPDRGLAKRSYSLTPEGEECLKNWVQTLASHARLIASFFDHAGKSLPEVPIPAISVFPPSRPTS
ncbi:MAG: PadR family transcriptional regulator [Synergistales bacterium]|jgi:PadR family transcriptional regulator PadR|nr:PadR family transcriptional regulator [Synergistales bacterium]